MKLNVFDRIMLGVVTLFLGIIALRPLLIPSVAHAQSTNQQFYVEPGIKMLLSPDRTKQTQGKVIVDLTTGDIWGFPTSQNAPYPIDTAKPQPATSTPMYLGKFDLAAMRRN